MSLNDFNSDINDLESSLLQQFSCMSTSNKEDLIAEFQKLLSPNKLNPEGCKFFLDMNNWNLQQAICSYFDYDAHKILSQPLPSMALISDITIGEGEEIPPNTRFIKTWRVANSGTTQWPPGCVLTFLGGVKMGSSDRVLVSPLKPGETTDISVSMFSPSDPGIFQGTWRMCTSTGQYFGDWIWVIVTVAEGGILGLTQQMNSINVLGSSKPSENISNPFEQNNVRSLVQQIKDSEMQIDEENQRN